MSAKISNLMRGGIMRMYNISLFIFIISVSTATLWLVKFLWCDLERQSKIRNRYLGKTLKLSCLLLAVGVSSGSYYLLRKPLVIEPHKGIDYIVGLVAIIGLSLIWSTRELIKETKDKNYVI